MIYSFAVHQHGACPYIKNRKWQSIGFLYDSIGAERYFSLINVGFRRNGHFIYKNCCSGCQACIPIRINVNHFQATKSQKRIIRKNQAIQIKLRKPFFSERLYEIYRKYQIEVHQEKDQSFFSKEQFKRVFVDTQTFTSIICYFDQDTLYAAGWFDQSKDAISSVYFIYDPQFSSLSPGSFSILYELYLARQLKKQWYHLGFYVEENKKMNYKSNFKPHQFLIENKWQNQLKSNH